MVSRRNVSLSAVFSAMLLAGCGTAVGNTSAPADDPANPALRGAWSVETRVTSLEYEGRRFSPAFAREGGDLTDMLEFFQRPRELACAEPSLDMTNRTNGDSVVGCFGGGPTDDGEPSLACFHDAQGTMRTDGWIESGSGEVAVTLVPPPGGSRDTDRMTFHLTQTLRRTGDCPLTP